MSIKTMGCTSSVKINVIVRAPQLLMISLGKSRKANKTDAKLSTITSAETSHIFCGHLK
jgi:hypothetical protein